MKPNRIFRLCVIVIGTLLAVACIYPKHGIRLFNHDLEFLSLHDLFSSDQEQYADISKIISDTTLMLNDSAAAIENDSLHIQHTAASMRLFSSLYKKMNSAKKDGALLRVLHYGDSQIEADRISGTLRECLQKKFGGSGVGIVPVTEMSDARSNVFIDASSDWQREELISKHQKGKQGRYGVLGDIYSVSGSNGSWIKIKTNKQSPDLQKKIGHLKLLSCGPFNCTAKIDTMEAVKVNPEDGTAFSVTDLTISSTSPSEIKLQFTDAQDVKLYGIALDGESGVTVDNVSLRGSSGTEFTRIDSVFLKQQLKQLNAGMIVFQFGVNVVPYVIKDYSYYRKLFYQQLAFIRRNAPDAAILVIGVSDMSRREKGVYVSYPNIEKIRNAMKEAAFEAGCAYWDLYEVMGGKNSMPQWVKAKPALANKDYTHFNNRGAEIVGIKLFNALMEDYARILKREEKEKLLAKK